MEKQPIDDLFARKLREAELPPSPDTFNRLQSRMASTQLPANRRRAALWWYGAAAASLLLISLFFYRNGRSTTSVSTDEVAREKRVKKTWASPPIEKPMPLFAQTEETQVPQTPMISEKQVAPTTPQTPLAIASAKRSANHERAEAIAIVDRQPLQVVAQKTQMPESGTPKNEVVALETPVDVALPKTLATTALPNQQRVVVMTIELPKIDAPVVALQPARVESTTKAQAGSLAGLFAKVKQLKNGDVLARTTPAKRPNEPRSRIGRMFEGVKESLRNETTLE